MLGPFVFIVGSFIIGHMPRMVKQFVYSLFFLAIFYGIGFGLYVTFLKPAPSCFDKLQNQGEEGIDCGPVCGNFCLPANLQPIEVMGQVGVFHPLPDRLAVLAQIQNPNEVGVATLRYHIALFDEKNMPLRTIDGDTFIFPREIKYLAEFPAGIDLASATRATIAFKEPQWVKSADLPQPAVSIQHYTPRVEGTQLVVEGAISNNDTVAASSVTVLALFYGVLGQIAGVSKSELSAVAPGETRAFTVQYPAFPDVHIAKTAVVVSARR